MRGGRVAIIVDPEVTHEFVLPEDENSDKAAQTVFTLKPMTGREFARMASNLTGAQDDPERIYDLLRVTVRGWKNLQLTSGKKLKFSETNIDHLPITIASTLAEASLNLAGITPEEAGN